MGEVTQLDTGNNAPVKILQDKILGAIDEAPGDMSVAEIVGVLEFIKFNLINSAD